MGMCAAVKATEGTVFSLRMGIAGRDPVGKDST